MFPQGNGAKPAGADRVECLPNRSASRFERGDTGRRLDELPPGDVLFQCCRYISLPLRVSYRSAMCIRTVVPMPILPVGISTRSQS